MNKVTWTGPVVGTDAAYISTTAGRSASPDISLSWWHSTVTAVGKRHRPAVTATVTAVVEVTVVVVVVVVVVVGVVVDVGVVVEVVVVVGVVVDGLVMLGLGAELELGLESEAFWPVPDVPGDGGYDICCPSLPVVPATGTCHQREPRQRRTDTAPATAPAAAAIIAAQRRLAPRGPRR